MKMYWQFKIKALAEKATADNKRINGAMIKREYSIPYSAKTLVKYLKQYYKLPSKKTHREKKRDMREIKSKYRAFEKIQGTSKNPNFKLLFLGKSVFGEVFDPVKTL